MRISENSNSVMAVSRSLRDRYQLVLSSSRRREAEGVRRVAGERAVATRFEVWGMSLFRGPLMGALRPEPSLKEHRLSAAPEIGS
jgi:hypothetical protein